VSPAKQEKIFPVEYAPELLRIAEGDLGSARLLLAQFGMLKSRAENIFFLAQQSIEKSLKAVLCLHHLPVPLVHELGILVAKLPAESSPVVGYEISKLSEFASIRRYEEGILELTSDEATDVVEIANRVLKWARGEETRLKQK
jgi:HEPN domain-containing protein